MVHERRGGSVSLILPEDPASLRAAIERVDAALDSLDKQLNEVAPLPWAGWALAVLVRREAELISDRRRMMIALGMDPYAMPEGGFDALLY